MPSDNDDPSEPDVAAPNPPGRSVNNWRMEDAEDEEEDDVGIHRVPMTATPQQHGVSSGHVEVSQLCRALHEQHESAETEQVSYKQLEHEYEQYSNHPEAYMRRLGVKRQINLEEETIPFGHPGLRFSSSCSLDAICVCGLREHGLDALLPEDVGQRNLGLQVELNRAGISFKDKHMKWGFDIKGRTFRLGIYEHHEAWLVWEPTREDVPDPEVCSGTTALCTPLLCQFALFWAWCIRGAPKSKVTVKTKDVIVNSKEELEWESNFFTTVNFPILPRDLQNVNNLFKEHYDGWAAYMSGQGIPFFVDHAPVVAVAKFGQDEPCLRKGVDHENEAATFSQMFDWASVARLGYAGAQTTRAFYTEELIINPRVAGQWVFTEPPPEEDEEDDRRESLLDAHPDALVTDLGLPDPPLYVYLGDVKVPLGVRARSQEEECGIMINLKERQRDLMPDSVPDDGSDDSDDQDDEPSPARTSRDYHVYHQAFSPQYGNIQTKGKPFSFFSEFPQVVQEMVQGETDEAIGEDVISVTMQHLYGEFSHKLRGQDGQMSVARAGVSAALAGEHFRGSTAPGKYRSLLKRQNKHLPHEHAVNTILGTSNNFGMRNEAYCIVHVEHLPAELRDGAYIFRNIIKQHLQWMTGVNKAYFPELAHNFTIFRPGVFPNTYLYALAPAMAFAEVQWKRLRYTPQRGLPNGATMTDVQITCLIERVLVYGLTGDRRVIPTRLARTLGLVPAIFEGCLPSFSAILKLTGPKTPSMSAQDWPQFNGEPLIISGPTVRFHYGPVWEQCHKDWCKLDLAIRLVNHSPTAIREVSRIISTLLVSTFIDDLVKHVYRAGYKEVMKGANRTAMEKTVLSTKITALNHWKDSHAPFSSDSQVAGLHMSGLITSIDEELSEEVALSWFDLASTLVGFIFNFPTQHAFRVPKGHLQRICHAIKPMVSVHYSYNNEIDVDYVKSTLITAAEQSLEDKRLWIMPWSTGKNKVVSHTLWIAVQPGTRKRARADSNNSDDLAPARRVVKEGLAFSQSLQRKDHTRAWRVKAKGKPALADLLPYLDSKSIPSNIKLTERAGGILFQQGLAEGFHMDLAHHRVGFWAAIVLAQLLPFCRVQIPEGKDRTFRSKTEAQAYMLGPHVKFVHAGDKGVTARIPWIEAFLLAWVFWLNVRDEKCEVGSRAGSDEKKFRKKLEAKALLPSLFIKLRLAEVAGPTIHSSWEYTTGKADGWQVRSNHALEQYEKDIVAAWNAGEDKVVALILGPAGLPLYREAMGQAANKKARSS